jgi:PKHD-type hydroxylase
MFIRFPNLLNEDQVTSIRARLEEPQVPWVDGRGTGGYQGAAVKYNQQLDEGSALARELGSVVMGQLEITPIFTSLILPHRVYPPMFTRYGEEMYFAKHVDGAVRKVPGTTVKIRADLAATVFLSPPDTYDGGELIMETDIGNQSSKAAAGDMIVFSGTARNLVNTVTRGSRLACSFWIQSMIRDEARREMLFELDRTIQRLTALQTDADCLIRLSAHYHALLHQWLEV